MCLQIVTIVFLIVPSNKTQNDGKWDVILHKKSYYFDIATMF